MTPQQLDKSLKQANDMMELLEPVFERGDIDEEQFKQAVRLYTQAVLIRARLTATQATRSER